MTANILWLVETSDKNSL